ncbi:prepilin-type N-terminal cleavage/methylation domain-containing protein [Pseudidiomarina sp. 1APR75-33.1]|uniref:prepilin-type N-terminal cleavage/methylation domain-containing protein n=1 Tax=Pseudidiomarina terrestris TaxID=2820060 RepID=UPI00264BAC23|nr:prepilin-type N-terminal cleavage/methylation domain-containing protein [Pseudidiomarina sp. 1APR75-33.1]MDN7126278.1 prepilin-type N-terminal cleavage/methylation domain-containing protein [Pseudidiomarina sp. 1APR75-33.1]
MRQQGSRLASGFTLIEIIIVILLLATLAIYSFGFLGLGSEMVVQVNQRNQLVAEQRFAIERLNRELRSSVPRSARANAACLEYMPMVGSNVYLTLPRPGPGGSQPMVVVTPYLPSGQMVGNYVLVYATGANFIYGNNQQRRKVVSAVANDTPQVGLSTLTLTGTPATFFTDSPARTFFIGDSPVSWCVNTANQTLVRFADYGLLPAQPDLAALSTAASSQQVMAVDVVNDLSLGQQPFYVSAPTLQRNNLVKFFLAFRSSEASASAIEITHEVHIPNVP